MGTVARPGRVTIVGAAALAAAATAGLSVSVAGRATAQQATVSCGSSRQALRALADSQRDLVRLRRTPTTRTTNFQRRVWRVRAQIVEYKLERDAAVHLVLYDGKQSYMTAAMPSARCLPANTRARRAIEGARAFLEGLCGPARPSWRPLGAVVIIDGVGFWASPHGQHGHARNYAELRPVTRIRLVAGCA